MCDSPSPERSLQDSTHGHTKPRQTGRLLVGDNRECMMAAAVAHADYELCFAKECLLGDPESLRMDMAASQLQLEVKSGNAQVKLDTGDTCHLSSPAQFLLTRAHSAPTSLQ